MNKPGYKTTEFWLTGGVTIAGLLGQVSQFLPGNMGIWASALASGLYAVSRGLAKS
jgi:hypothetical protein